MTDWNEYKDKGRKKEIRKEVEKLSKSWVPEKDKEVDMQNEEEEIWEKRLIKNLKKK